MEEAKTLQVDLGQPVQLFYHKLPGFLPHRRRFSSWITSLGVPFITSKLCIVKLLLLFLSYDQAVFNIMNVENMKMNIRYLKTLRKVRIF